MKSKIAIIAVLFLTIIGVMFYAAIEKNKKNVHVLKESGYIINSQKLTSNKDNNNQISYFNSETKYSKSYDENIVFADTDGKSTRVPISSFIHYEDGSIGVLKKAVVVNIDDILNNDLKYYNIFQNNLIERKESSYVLENINKIINFKRFIVKTADNKYLIMSEGMKIRLDGGREIDVEDNYAELSIIDEEVVRLDNRKVNIQTIGKDSSLIIGEGIVLKLDNHYILKDNEPLFTLDQMIINSQDNINIFEFEEEKATESEEEVQYDENGNIINNNSNESSENNTDNNVVVGDNELINGESEVDEKTSMIPTATIEDIEITSNKMDASIKIVDKDSLMSGKTIVMVTENATGKHVYEESFESGQYNLAIEVLDLEPNVTYNLTTRISYKRDDVEYVTDAISQLFTTESLGINLEKEYATSSEVSYKVKFDSYSKVKSCNISLINRNGGVIEKKTVDADTAKSRDGFTALFTNLEKNTKYGILIDNILYDNYIMSDDNNIETSVKTLKARPTFGNVSFSMDKKNSSFTLTLNNIKDPDNGIESYTYEIYDARTYNENAQPVKVIEKKSKGSVDVDIDGKSLQRGVPYIYKVVTEFYDNEKYIEYITPLSDIMQLDGVEGSYLTWRPEEVTFERIKGTILITDPANTIDLTKRMKIVYTNSIGTTKQFNTEGNLVIPIDINNLRQNESYNIAVYGTVDFQDGNEVIDSYYIGSVTVVTNQTNPIQVTFSSEQSASSAFNVTAQLKKGVEYDNTLEAKTLTGITFTIYEGNNLTGKIIKSMKIVDKDLREYYSDLKKDYYDSSFLLSPAFFGLANSDIKSEYITILISDAYDYSDFKNSIDIINNIYTIKVNNLAPDTPVNTDNAVEYQYIRNRNADSEHHDPNLDGNTIVGIRVKALYDNTRRYAKYIDYHVYDSDTGEKISNGDVRYTVASDGTIDYTEIYFDYGTPYDVKDKDLRRGHNYYVTYDAYLKLSDTDELTHYPVEEGVVLKSKKIDVPKQEAIITTYPSSSKVGELTLKYTLKDVDNSLYTNEFISKIGVSRETFETVSTSSIEQTDTYKEVTLNNLYSSYLGVYVTEALIKNSDSIKDKEILFQNFVDPKFQNNNSYSIDLETNRALISIDNYNKSDTNCQKIAGLKITFECDGKKVTKDYRTISDSNFAIVDLYELASFRGKTVNMSVDVYYDDERIGYDLPGSIFALQSIGNEYNNGLGDYYYINDNQGLYNNGKVAMGSMNSKEFIQNEFRFKNLANDFYLNIPFAPDAQGIAYNYTYFLPKGLSISRAVPSGSSSFEFEQLIPGIRLTDEEGRSTLVPGIKGVLVKGSVFGFEYSEFENNEMQVEIYETDEYATKMDLIKTVPLTEEQFIEGFNIDDLLPDQRYAIKIYANLKNKNGEYVKHYLYDLDKNVDGRTYYFDTLSSVPVTDINLHYNFVKYDDKNLVFSYKLGKLVGYDKIRYKMYKLTYNQETGVQDKELLDIDIPDSTRFTEEMLISVPCDPGSQFIFGERYELIIQPIVVADVEGETHEIELINPGDYTFYLRKLSAPTFNVRNSVYSDDDYVEFTVTIYDTWKIMATEDYTIEIYNSAGENITPEQYKNSRINIYDRAKKFVINGINPQESYTLCIKYAVDIENNGNTVDRVSKFVTRTTNSTGIDIGDISSTQNITNPSTIDLIFLNSTKLTKIDKISYTIYNEDDGTTYSGNSAFIPREINIGGHSAYAFTISDVSLSKQGLYLIQLQFSSDNVIVADTSIEYAYIMSGE